jgi:hypothetical protein
LGFLSPFGANRRFIRAFTRNATFSQHRGVFPFSPCLLVIEQRPRRRKHGTKRPRGRRGLRGWGGNGTKQKTPELLVHYNNNNGWKTADGRRTSRTGERPPSNCGDADSSNNTPGSDPLSFPSFCLFSHYFYFPSERADNMHDTNFALFLPFCVYVSFLGKHSWRGFPISFHSIPFLLSCLSLLYVCLA